MSLVDKVNALATRIGQEINAVRSEMGGGGSGVQQVFAQETAPVVDPGTPYVWFQTGLGDGGQDMTLWVEDGQ